MAFYFSQKGCRYYRSRAYLPKNRVHHKGIPICIANTTNPTILQKPFVISNQSEKSHNFPQMLCHFETRYVISNEVRNHITQSFSPTTPNLEFVNPRLAFIEPKPHLIKINIE